MEKETCGVPDEEALTAAWRLTVRGGEISPEEQKQMLAVAEAFRSERAKEKRIMAMTVLAAHTADTDAVVEMLKGVLTEGDDWATEVAFSRAAQRFVTENQEMGHRLLQEAIERTGNLRLRDHLKRLRDELGRKQASAAQDSIDRAYRAICEAEERGELVSPGLLGDSLEQYSLLCGVSTDLQQKAHAAFYAGLIAWKCGDTKTARGLHAVALDRTELLISEGHINPADPKVRHLYQWSAYWRATRE